MPSEERWQMTGSSHETYEHYMVSALFAPWATVLLEQAQPQSRERVLDVVCGTRVVARLALSYVGSAGKVTGVDLNVIGVSAVAGEPLPCGLRAGNNHTG